MESTTEMKPWGWGRCYHNWGCEHFWKVQPFFKPARPNYRDNCIQKECWLANLTWDPNQWKPCEWGISQRFQGQCVPRGTVSTDALFPPKCKTKSGWRLRR